MGSLFSVRLSDGPFLCLRFFLPCDTRAHQNVATADCRDANNLFKNKEGEAKTIFLSISLMVLFFVFFFSFRVTLVPTKMLLLLILGMQTTFLKIKKEKQIQLFCPSL